MVSVCTYYVLEIVFFLFLFLCGNYDGLRSFKQCSDDALFGSIVAVGVEIGL